MNLNSRMLVLVEMKKKRVKEVMRWPGFPGRFLFFLWGGCEVVFEPLLLFVVVEVFEFGLWSWPSISNFCLTAPASSPVFSVEKLQLSQLVMFEFDIDSLLFLPKPVFVFTLWFLQRENERKMKERRWVWWKWGI